MIKKSMGSKQVRDFENDIDNEAQQISKHMSQILSVIDDQQQKESINKIYETLKENANIKKCNQELEQEIGDTLKSSKFAEDIDARQLLETSKDHLMLAMSSMAGMMQQLGQKEVSKLFMDKSETFDAVMSVKNSFT